MNQYPAAVETQTTDHENNETITWPANTENPTDMCYSSNEMKNQSTMLT